MVALGLVALWLGRGWWRHRRAAAELARAHKAFAYHRDRLAAEFLQAAGSQGKPRGLRWVRSDLDGPPFFATDRTNGDIYALVAVIIGFEAIAGGGMEDVAAVGNLRSGSAVFRWQRGRWTTDGWAILNLAPPEAIAHYTQNLVPVTNTHITALETESKTK